MREQTRGAGRATGPPSFLTAASSEARDRRDKPVVTARGNAIAGTRQTKANEGDDAEDGRRC